jgi:hypothetical protein
LAQLDDSGFGSTESRAAALEVPLALLRGTRLHRWLCMKRGNCFGVGILADLDLLVSFLNASDVHANSLSTPSKNFLATLQFMSTLDPMTTNGNSEYLAHVSGVRLVSFHISFQNVNKSLLDVSRLDGWKVSRHNVFLSLATASVPSLVHIVSTTHFEVINLV